MLEHMKRNILPITIATMLSAGMMVSCAKKLDRQPPNSITAAQVFATDSSAKQALAQVYAAYALTGSNGSGSTNLVGIDAGTSDFVRLLWDASELSTDEAVCAWNDPGVPDFHNMSWNSSNAILLGLYFRIMYQVTVANAFIQEANAAKGSFTGGALTDLNHYIAESRFLRAFDYWEMLDLFGKAPFVTEKSPIGVGTYLPPQSSGATLFSYIESELLSLDSGNAMVAARQNEFARADQAAVWALLARLYLNAQVYTGTARYTDAITYSSKVINNGGYALLPKFQDNFLADNSAPTNTEQILSIAYDGVNIQNYGGTTFIINAEVGGSMNPAAYGVPTGGWGGNRTTANIPSLFPDLTGTTDKRSLFYTSGQSESISSISTFTDGYPSVKFQNVTSTGQLPAGAATFCSTSFPLFRLAEQLLIYSEAVLQGGTGGSQAQALTYYNMLRDRASGNNASYEATSIALQDILNERGRELSWECFRRTDLIRFGQFTSSNYVWPWKGGIASGTGVDAHFNLFPLPASDLNANSNLSQNPGYGD
jgi:hypothetical protein